MGLLIAGADWSTIARLIYSHRNLAKSVACVFRELALVKYKNGGLQLDASPGTFDLMIEEWDRNVVKRTAAVLDHMFKAVSLRDAHDTLHYGESMWRLSWITFIFLPLTFSTGLFGMSKGFRPLKSLHCSLIFCRCQRPRIKSAHQVVDCYFCGDRGPRYAHIQYNQANVALEPDEDNP